MEAFSAGTLAGAGSFRCEACGFAIALHELDQVPSCPNCGGAEFRRASLFSRPSRREPAPAFDDSPSWLEDARDALAEAGSYIAFEDDERVHVLPLQEGWTRIGRSLSAHVRFDDPTVSRRHALVYCEQGGARILDDRSLNGVFRNGERIEHAELEDGDEIGVGRFRLYFLHLAGEGSRSPEGATTTVG